MKLNYGLNITKLLSDVIKGRKLDFTKYVWVSIFNQRNLKSKGE